jgi:hypothetical protein
MFQLQWLYNIKVGNGGLRICTKAVMTYLQAYTNIYKKIWRGGASSLFLLDKSKNVTAKLTCSALDMLP